LRKTAPSGLDGRASSSILIHQSGSDGSERIRAEIVPADLEAIPVGLRIDR